MERSAIREQSTGRWSTSRITLRSIRATDTGISKKKALQLQRRLLYLYTNSLFA